MSIASFKPTLWSASVETAFPANLVVIDKLSTVHSSLTAPGSVIKINGATRPTVQTYTGSITTEDLNGTDIDLVLNESDYFSFYVEDIDAAQSNVDIQAVFTEGAAAGLAEKAEASVIAKLILGADSNTTAVITDGASAKAALLQAAMTLTAANVPASNRHAVVNPAFAALLLGGLSDVAASGSSDALRNGVIGNLYGLTVSVSNLFAEATPQVVAYHAAAASFKNSVQKVRALESADKFATQVAGLHVYGSVVVRPEAIAVITND